jgi:hypothetical protein
VLRAFARVRDCERIRSCSRSIGPSYPGSCRPRRLERFRASRLGRSSGRLAEPSRSTVIRRDRSRTWYARPFAEWRALRSTQKFLLRDVDGGWGGATRPSAALAPSAPAAHRLLMRCSRAARSMSRASARSQRCCGLRPQRPLPVAARRIIGPTVQTTGHWAESREAAAALGAVGSAASARRGRVCSPYPWARFRLRLQDRLPVTAPGTVFTTELHDDSERGAVLCTSQAGRRLRQVMAPGPWATLWCPRANIN